MKGFIYFSFINKKGALAVLALLALCIIGCSDLTESDGIEEASGLNATALKASVLGNANATNFSHYLIKRFPNRSSRAAADTKAIIVTKSLDALDNSDIACIKSVYDAGGAVVVVDPAADKIEGFQDAIGHSDILGTVGAANGASGSFCDAYIFNNKGNHLVVDYTRSGKQGYTITEEVSKGDFAPESADPESAELESAPNKEESAARAVQPEEIVLGETAADYSPVIDEVIKWIETPPETRNEAGSARTANAARSLGSVNTVLPGGDITELSAAASWTRIFQVSSAGYTYYDGSDMTGTAAISNTQYVWSCYSVDQDKDYYLVQDYIVIPNSGMYRGIWRHYHFPLDWKECGLYMTSMSVDSKLLGENGNVVPLGGTGGGVSIPSSSPKTANETTNVTSTMAWDIGGIASVNIGSKDSGAAFMLFAGVSFEKKTTYSIQDVGVVNRSSCDGANARFDYTTNVVSTYNTGSNTMRPPADLACNTAQFTHYWRWEINKPKLCNGGNNGGGTHTDSGRFGMCTDFKIQYEEAAAWGGAGSTKRWQLNKEDVPSNFTWWFPIMNRNVSVN